MKNSQYLKSNKGITLLTLTLTIVIMLILSFTVSINVKPYVERKQITNLETDITKLKEEISHYYSENKTLPIANKYINTQMLQKNVNDNDNYYVIDLSKINNLNLNYGADYKKIQDYTTQIDNLVDLYIINEQSHTIYYPKGIYYNEKINYTTMNLETLQIQDIPLSKIEIIGETTGSINDTIQLKAKLIPEFVENTGVTWQSSDENIATVDENGKVTLKVVGTVTITATSKDNDAINEIHEVNVTYKTVQLSVIATENSTVNGEIPSYSNPVVPKGFKAVDITTGDNTINSNAKWKNAEGYKYGLVIEDEEGNQFVWVAVDGNEVKLDRYNFSANGVATISGNNIKQNYYIEQGVTGVTDTTTYGNATAKNINEFINSVNTNGGYYIARFEASYGIDNKPNSKISTETISTASDGTITMNGLELENGIIPTQEGTIWNNITQKNAATVCQNMYTEEYGVESDLMNSYAWDTAICFIQKYSGNTDYSIDKSGNIGTNIPYNTGKTDDMVCNIYDLSGNYREWTTETSNNTNRPATSRGGCFCVPDTYTSYYYNDGVDDLYYILSFRPVLYIK